MYPLGPLGTVLNLDACLAQGWRASDNDDVRILRRDQAPHQIFLLCQGTYVLVGSVLASAAPGGSAIFTTASGAAEPPHLAYRMDLPSSAFEAPSLIYTLFPPPAPPQQQQQQHTHDAALLSSYEYHSNRPQEHQLAASRSRAFPGEASPPNLIRMPPAPTFAAPVAIGALGATGAAAVSMRARFSTAAFEVDTPLLRLAKREKRAWVKEEDELLMQLVAEYGPCQWARISRRMPGRIGKQCRERWVNHVSVTVNKNPWSPQEDEMLLCLHEEVGFDFAYPAQTKPIVLKFAAPQWGNRWCEIARRMPGRPENAVKNHYNSLASRHHASKRPRTHNARAARPKPIGMPLPVQLRAARTTKTGASASSDSSNRVDDDDGEVDSDNDALSVVVEENANEIALRSLAEVAGI